MYKLIERLLPKPLKVLAIRFDRSPLRATGQMCEFVHTRASYVAQTSLYGYLKARMGIQFRELFVDETFSNSIRHAAIKVYASCLSDLTVYAVALAGQDGRLSPDDAVRLARHCFVTGLDATLSDEDRHLLAPDTMSRLETRLANTLWANAAISEAAFAGSATDLVRYAPVIDQFKDLDGDIVTNSIRFRWVDVRRQLKARLDGPAVAADWLNRATPASS